MPIRQITCGVALACFSSAALAQTLDRLTDIPDTTVDRSFEPAAKSCDEVRWSPGVLSRLPSINEACQAVEQRNGVTYVKLEGEVEEVQNEGKRIRVDFQDGAVLVFRPTPNTTLYIDGEPTPFSEVREDQKLNFYIPENRLQAELQPDPARLSFVVVPIDLPEQQMAGDRAGAATGRTDRTRMAMGDEANDQDAMYGDELPATAGWLPLLGLAGGVLTLIGAGAAVRRRLR